MESSHEEPRCGAAGMAATTTRFSSFVVTSSNDATFAKPSTPATTGSTMPLNPDAQEFRFSPDFADTLYVLNAAAAATPQQWSPAAMTDFSARSAISNNGVSHSRGLPFTPSPASAGSDVMDNEQLVRLTEAYIHNLYDRKCREEGLHMLSVFRLHPRTTNARLYKIFFITGASAAEVLDPSVMPARLSRAFRAVRQRAGVVFCKSKEFAMVGIEKMNDFVPDGQDQRLVVRYCGPDQQATSPSASSQPPHTDSGEQQRGDALSSAMAASTPPNRRTVPPPRHRDASNSRDVFPASVVAMPSLFAGMNPIVSTGTATPAVVGGTTSAAGYDSIDQYFLQKYANQQVYLVGLHNLDPSTTTESLNEMLCRLEALHSELLPRSVSVEGTPHHSGVAVFGSKERAIAAAAALNGFAPVGQRQPVVAHFLGWPTIPQFASPAAHGNVNSATAVTASTPRESRSSPSPAAGVPAVTALVESVERQLRSESLDETQLAEDIQALILCAESGERERERVAAVLQGVLLSMGDRCSTIEGPLSGAFHAVHSRLGIRTQNAPATSVDTSIGARKGEDFFRLIGHALMVLVDNEKADRETRIVAARQCAYLYRYTYMPKTPLRFATLLFRRYEKELLNAKEFRCRRPDAPSSLVEGKEHWPWFTLIDALHEMVRVWSSLDPRTYAQDPSRDEYERFTRTFRGVDMDIRCPAAGSLGAAAVVLSAAAGEQEGGACTPRNSAPNVPVEAANRATFSRGQCSHGTSASAKESHLVTPSARPTPRPILRSFNTPSNLQVRQSTPVTKKECFRTPQVMLASAASNYTRGTSQLSADMESAGMSVSRTQHSAVITPPYPNGHSNSSFRLSSLAPLPGVPTTPVESHASTLLETPTLPTLAFAPATAAGAVSPGGTSTASAPFAERSESKMLEGTVYITKLPSCLSAGKARRLLQHFGDFRKVRLCHDDKETTRGGSAEALAVHNLRFSQLCFGFVEFAESSGARAMIDFFRNEVHKPSAFDFLRVHDTLSFDDTELNQLRYTRANQARNPIYDQHPLDATPTKPSLFGIIEPHRTVGTYLEITAEEVAEALQSLHKDGEEAQQQPQVQVSASSPNHQSIIISTLDYTATLRELLYDSPEIVAPTPQNRSGADADRGGGAFGIAAPPPTCAVHSPSGFPLSKFISTDTLPLVDCADVGRHHHSASDSGDLQGDLSSLAAGSPLYEDDDDGIGMAES
ncbi:hypothetical protein JKF63_07438 [Porcisia hertigi]|uniref:RNA-binding protein n=1 Tax=Porcisia hertigi TaxID=2761500 RepID=A0A836LL53_9TRYP|nr:hypothetical protein JKF63_07438 [Porcisia hertigi]